ncbi:unnamed protein product [Rotaria sp. Silwood1]|nr:unnamed protein product [Rotaria sp. Silwood1]
MDQNSMLIKTLCASHCYASHHQSCNVIYPVSSSNSLAVDNHLRTNSTNQTTPPFPSFTASTNGAHSEANNHNFASSVQQQQFTRSKSSLLSSISQRQIAGTSNIKTTTFSSTKTVLITGSSIIRDLQQGNTILNNKQFNIIVRTKPNCTIEQMNESIKNKEFNETSAMVMCIGTINMKYDKPHDAFANIIALIDSVKASYPKTKLFFTTIPK